MGMPITIDISDCNDESAFKPTFDRLRQIDENFSTHKKDSEVSRFAAGQIAESTLSSELKEVIKACREAEVKTGGYFSAWAGGKFNPSGYVKGWAIAQAGQAIEKQGFKTYCIGAGGDILARSDSDFEWKIGIQDPSDRSNILNALSISNGAVATSGNYERGEHIINPKTGKPANEILSFSVTGPDIIKADILATAGFAAGKKSLELVEAVSDYEALAVYKDGSLVMSSGMSKLVA